MQEETARNPENSVAESIVPERMPDQRYATVGILRNMDQGRGRDATLSRFRFYGASYPSDRETFWPILNLNSDAFVIMRTGGSRKILRKGLIPCIWMIVSPRDHAKCAKMLATCQRPSRSLARPSLITAS